MRQVVVGELAPRDQVPVVVVGVARRFPGDLYGSDAARVSLGYLSEVERGRKEASSELLSAICGALDVPLSRVLADAGEELAHQEHAAARLSNIDVTTKVVIPQAVSMAVA